MRLVEPTDFDVLEILEDGRNVAPNIAVELGHDRPYINTRLPHLHDQGLIDRIGPANNSGLYALIERGQTVLAHRSQYAELDPKRLKRLSTSRSDIHS